MSSGDQFQLADHQARGRAWARWALQRWESFPVSREPRSLVMTGPVVLFDSGFRSGEAKMAFLHGDITADAELPDGLLNVLRGGSRQLPVPASRHWRAPLVITQARSGQTEFPTDRGRRELAAWQLSSPDVIGAFWVLDPAVAARCWSPPEPAPPRPSEGQPHRAVAATIDHNGQTLNFTFIGGKPEYVQYPAAEVLETDQAVAVLPVARDTGPPGWRTAEGYTRTITARLACELGQRVLTDLDASPVPVNRA